MFEVCQGQVIPECGTRSERDAWQEMGISRYRFWCSRYFFLRVWSSFRQVLTKQHGY